MNTPSNETIPRVLVAEDNAVNLRVALRMLAKLGYEADAAENGLQAVDAASARPYALILMDCQMPELDGYEATARLRATQPGDRRLPIIAMTANALPGDRERCLAAGMDDYLAKPITLDALAAVVARWAPRRAAAAEDSRASLPVADAEVLAQLGDPAAGGDPEFLAEVASIFLDETPGRLDAMRDAVSRGDAEALARMAHALKSGCGSLGLRRMQALCGDVEAGAAHGAVEAATGLVTALTDELVRAERALNDAVRKPA